MKSFASRLSVVRWPPFSAPEDLRAARANVAAQNAALGIAIAHLYPDLTLSANGGYASQTLSTLFQTDAGLWQLAANLLQPLYDGGVLHARRRSWLQRSPAIAARC